ncbi:response regulator [Photobacterium minamisatsumaniensis]|uniref:response regulator n=1 Tax=Photobacterium minamisatsumaniensis TaxID=2910233 RepID=UPI003D0E9430
MLEEKDVLIVEDDPVFRVMLSGFLKSQGCHVREAENGLEGLRALRENIPDVLLCDLAMPVLTGMEFVEEVSVQYPMIPIIVISGSGDMADVASALRLGVKDFLVKPLNNIMVLKSAMLSVLKLHDSVVDSGDFSSQWVSIDDETVIDEELEWHIEELKANPRASRELLMGLMPDTESSLGNWRLNYCVLQSADVQPVLLDYTWLIDGRLAFYLVDSATGDENGTATTLLIRAFFNDYLRNRMSSETNSQGLVKVIENGMKSSGYASPVRAIFGVFDATDNSISLSSAGLAAGLQTSDGNYAIQGQNWLGNKAGNNESVRLKLAKSGGRLSLSEIGSASFSVTFKRIA